MPVSLSTATELKFAELKLGRMVGLYEASGAGLGATADSDAAAEDNYKLTIGNFLVDTRLVGTRMEVLSSWWCEDIFFWRLLFWQSNAGTRR